MSMLVKERLHDVRGYDLDLRTQLCILGAMFSLMNKDNFFFKHISTGFYHAYV